MKWQAMGLERIFEKHLFDKGLGSKIHSELLKLNYKKRIKKWTKDFRYHYQRDMEGK